MTDDRPLTLQLRHLKALASPVRHEIFVMMGETGPCSVRELADAMGLPPPALYYHVHKLVQVGLVEALGQRSATTRRETVYARRSLIRVPARSSWSKAYRSALATLNASTLRIVSRRVASFLELDDGSDGAEEGKFVLRHYRVRTTAATRELLRERLEAVDELVRELWATDEGEVTSVLLVQVPIID